MIKIEMEIIEINSDNIKIRTSHSMSDKEKVINLNTKKTEFILENGKTKRLVTPTTDAGDTYNIYINI